MDAGIGPAEVRGRRRRPTLCRSMGAARFAAPSSQMESNHSPKEEAKTSNRRHCGKLSQQRAFSLTPSLNAYPFISIYCGNLPLTVSKQKRMVTSGPVGVGNRCGGVDGR